VWARHAADGAQTRAEEEDRLAAGDRGERPREDEEAALRRRGVLGRLIVEVSGDRREGVVADQGLISRADRVVERVLDLLVVGGEILAELEVRVVGNDGQ